MIKKVTKQITETFNKDEDLHMTPNSRTILKKMQDS